MSSPRVVEWWTAKRIRVLVSAIFVSHYLIGLAVWCWFGYIQFRVHTRDVPFEFAQDAIRDDFVNLFLPRIWKCVLPLTVSIVALCQYAKRPQFCTGCLLGIFTFSIVMCYLDIQSGRWEVHFLGPGILRGQDFYFTWWWYRGGG